MAVRFPDREPLIFLQSLEDPDLCFLTLPVLAVDPQYQLTVSKEDRELVGLAPGRTLTDWRRRRVPGRDCAAGERPYGEPLRASRD